MTRLPNLGARTDPHSLGSLLRPGACSCGDPKVCRGSGGTKFPNLIADEHHPDAATSGHARAYHGDLNANTSVADGSANVDTHPRVDGRCTALRRKTGEHSDDHRRYHSVDIHSA